MDNLHVTQVFQSDQNLRREMLRESVIDRALALEEFDETASGAILNQQVQLVLVLKGLEKLYDRGVVEIR